METLILSAGGIACAYFSNTRDPLLLHEPFPWLAILPLLAGLQHGFLAALLSGSSLALAAQWLVGDAVGAAGWWLLGCLAVGLLAGQYRDRFDEHLSKYAREAVEHRAALSVLQQRYHLLERAHAELRAEYVAAGPSVVEAVEETARAVSAADSEQEAIAHLFELLSLRGRIESASFFFQRQSGLSAVPDGQVGSPTEVYAAHPLITLAAKEHRLVSVTADDYLRLRDRTVLAAVPISTPEGELIGVVAVHHMPLTALEARHLTYLHTLANSLALALSRVTRAPVPDIGEGSGGTVRQLFRAPVVTGLGQPAANNLSIAVGSNRTQISS